MIDRILRAALFKTTPLVLLGIALAACGGESGTTSGTTGGTGGAGGASGTTVGVALAEWSITLDKATAPAGKVSFSTENKGQDMHELVVLKTDLAEDKLPLNAEGDVDEEAMGVVSQGEIPDIQTGKSDVLTLDLAKGKYALICNIAMPEGGMIEHHYALGMHTGFTVE
ncbi:MAG: hypothetical protein ABI193_12540 [Minicystis sp.]